MSEGNSSEASRPSWFRNLVTQRWRTEAPAPTGDLGPAGFYVERQVEQRLRSPEWDNEARPPRADDAAKPAPPLLDNRSKFPPGGYVGLVANQRPYPA